MGLETRAGDRTDNLSAGMQRRLNIAAGILHDPALLLLDEPTVGVDVVAREAIHQVLHTLRRQGMAILLTTHDLDQAAELADRVGVLSRGQLLVADEPSRLIADAFGEHRELVVSLSEAEVQLGRGEPLLGEDRAQLGRMPLEDGQRLDQVSALERVLRDSGANVDEVRIREPSLRSAFFYLAGEDLAA